MKENYYSGEVIDLWFEDGVLYGLYTVENVNIDVAKQATHERLDLIEEVAYPSIVDYTHVKSTTKEARDYFATEEASRYITAMAILTDSNVGKIIVNFFLTINKPKFPTKIFTSKADALTWLHKYK